MARAKQLHTVRPHPENSFGNFIRRRRQDLGLYQREIAQHVGIGRPEFVGFVEMGTRQFDLDRLPRLAEILQVNLAELTKLAMEEKYPALAAALFSDPSAFRKGAKRGSAEGSEFQQKVNELERPLRQTIIQMVNGLYDSQVRAAKTRRRVNSA